VARQARRESTATVEEGGSNQAADDPVITQYNQLKRDLATAQSKYTENHPDVIDLKKKVAKLEPRVKEVLEKQTAAREARLRALREQRGSGPEVDPAVAVLDPALERQLTQYTDHIMMPSSRQNV